MGFQNHHSALPVEAAGDGLVCPKRGFWGAKNGPE